MKNDGEEPKSANAGPPPKRAEPGAESQLHNYNVILTRLGDLFGDEDAPEQPKK